MSNEDRFLTAVGRASLIAGPLFLSLTLLIEYQMSAPDPLPIGPDDILKIILSTLILLPLTVGVGACLAFPVCLILGGGLLHLANLLPMARPAVLWIGVGAGAAAAICYGLFGPVEDSGSLAFVGTAMACAALVRSRFCWD